MDEIKKKKYWRIAFYLLGFIPSVFIISLLSFYIHAGLILNYWNISGINPNDFKLYSFYQYVIIYSWVFTFFSIPVWLIIVIMYYLKNENKTDWKFIISISIIYLIAIVLVFSKIFQFALD